MNVGLSSSTRSGNATQFCHGRSPREICSTAAAEERRGSRPAHTQPTTQRDVDPRGLAYSAGTCRAKKIQSPRNTPFRMYSLRVPGSHGGDAPGEMWFVVPPGRRKVGAGPETFPPTAETPEGRVRRRDHQGRFTQVKIWLWIAARQSGIAFTISGRNDYSEESL